MRLGRIAATFVAAVLAVSLLGLGVAADPGAPGSESSASAPGLQIILIADDRYTGSRRVPPPARAVRGIQSATFTVNWNPGSCTRPVASWPSGAQTAFLYAVSIWSSLIDSSVAIEVDACWVTDLAGNVLGSAGTKRIYADYGSFPYSGTWYAGALADSLEGIDLESSYAEIEANFNANRSDWYYGTDGNPGGSQYDFASVVLHELCHGLGFHGFAYVEVGLGYNLWYGYPAIYDRFTEDGNGLDLDTYANGSAALDNALRGQVGGGVYWFGAAGVAENGSSVVQLYSPSIWSSGSSYSHLGQSFNGTPHSLMTYSLSNGDSQHDPGAIVMGMLADMGWTVPVDVTIQKQVVGGGTNL
ncbi:MAG: hypothetical protein E3J64_02065, partial [Anaerolineales bacterium]